MAGPATAQSATRSAAAAAGSISCTDRRRSDSGACPGGAVAVLEGADGGPLPARAADVRRIGQAPAGADPAHPLGAQRRVEQVVAAALQPAPPDPLGGGRLLRLEELVQVADRDVLRGGDAARRELR